MIEFKNENGINTLKMQGNLIMITADVSALIHRVYNVLSERNPLLGKEFRKLIEETIKDGILWEEEEKEDGNHRNPEESPKTVPVKAVPKSQKDKEEKVNSVLKELIALLNDGGEA